MKLNRLHCDKELIRVVHLTPHMSGGLAAVLLSTLKYSERYTPSVGHEIVIFDEVLPNINELFSEYRNKLFINKSYSFIHSKLKEADIVHIEYWNHPLIYKFLYEFNFPPVRVLACCHVSGLHRPQIITESMVKFSDIFLAVTKATDSHEFFKDSSNPAFRQKLRFIRYPIDVDRFENNNFNNNISDKKHFNVGYVGTVNYSKIHRNFLTMSSKVDIPSVKFIICGEDKVDHIEAESKKYRTEIFDFMGFQKNISYILKKFDIFAYPLKSTHYGSGEQAILEAMYYGLPVVAFSNPAEAEIIQNNVTGLLVDNEEDYVKAIEYLYNNPEERKRIGNNARKFVETELHPRKCFSDLETIYRELMKASKKHTSFDHRQDETIIVGDNDPHLGAKLFIESLGNSGLEFLESLKNSSRVAHEKIAKIERAMKVQTKGSIYQYLYFFPEDPYLKYWVNLIRKYEKFETKV